MNVSQWKPFNTAPKIGGTRILAWCNASESESGIIEMVYRESVNSKTKEVIGYWDSVIDHPWQNACLNPEYWMESPIPPEPPLSVPPTISELKLHMEWCKKYDPQNYCEPFPELTEEELERIASIDWSELYLNNKNDFQREPISNEDMEKLLGIDEMERLIIEEIEKNLNE